jgi:hypothetical protein
MTDSGATEVHLRLQSPAERREVRCAPGTVAGQAERYRDQMGFPADWVEDPDQQGWDCAVGFEPVHADYWRSLAETQHELRLARARVEHLEEQLRVQIKISQELSALAGEPQ